MINIGRTIEDLYTKIRGGFYTANDVPAILTLLSENHVPKRRIENRLNIMIRQDGTFPNPLAKRLTTTRVRDLLQRYEPRPRIVPVQ
jgi:hypothetical protein